MSTPGAFFGRSFLKRQQAAVNDAVAAAQAGIATVTGVTGNLVSVQRSGAGTSGTQLYAHAAGQQVAIGDTVALLPMTNGSFLAIKAGGAPAWNASVPMKADVYRNAWAQNTANTASGSNTATWLTAMTETWTLPTGTYTLIGSCAVSLMSGYGGVDLQFTIGGTSNTRSGIVPSSTVYTPVHGVCIASGLSGAVTITVAYKGTSGSGQTTSAQNPWADISAQRTS